jgi:hypothetical protein
LGPYAGGLTGKELAELKAKLGVKASGAKAELARKIVERGRVRKEKEVAANDSASDVESSDGGGQNTGMNDTPSNPGGPKEPHEMTREEYVSQATAIPKVYGDWNAEVGDDRYSKRLSQTDKIFEKVVKQKLAEAEPGEAWPFPPVSVKRESGPYDLKDGHHRIEVAKRLGMRVVPATLVDQKAFGHSKPVNTYVEIGDDGEPRIIQPNNESLPPINVTVPETKPSKKKPDHDKAHRAAVKAALAAGSQGPA